MIVGEHRAGGCRGAQYWRPASGGGELMPGIWPWR